MPSSLADDAWQRLAEEAWTGVAEWRAQHPRATLREIEQAVDERLADLRARLVQDVALAGARTNPSAGDDRPRCPECGTPLHLEGARTRRLRTRHDRAIVLTRAYARCPACGTGVFPPR